MHLLLKVVLCESESFIFSSDFSDFLRIVFARLFKDGTKIKASFEIKLLLPS